MNDVLNAMRLHHEAKKAEAVANLNILLNQPVGIGDHPIVEDAIKWLSQLDSANSNLQTITDEYPNITTEGLV